MSALIFTLSLGCPPFTFFVRRMQLQPTAMSTPMAIWINTQPLTPMTSMDVRSMLRLLRPIQLDDKEDIPRHTPSPPASCEHAPQ